MSDCCHDYIESPSLCLLVVAGVSTTVQLAGGKDTTLSSRLAAAELQLITDHMQSSYIRRPEKRHVSSLLREKREETEYTARARGYSRREHITRGNTYPRVGRTHITILHQISPGAWPGICVWGNRKSGRTHISATPPTAKVYL